LKPLRTAVVFFMRNIVCILVSVVVVLLSEACKQKKGEAPSATTAVRDSSSTESLYPYPQYIESQLAYLDTALLGIEMVVYENGIKIDSGFIDRGKLRQLAKEFIEPDPNRNEIRDQYIENSFNDLTLNTVTFSITSKSPKNTLQQADILLNPDTRQVKYVVIKKQTYKDGVSENKSLMWVHNMNFQINTSFVDKEGKETTKLIKVVWDKPLH
jgi:hypothetical protein